MTTIPNISTTTSSSRYPTQAKTEPLLSSAVLVSSHSNSCKYMIASCYWLENWCESLGPLIKDTAEKWQAQDPRLHLPDPKPILWTAKACASFSLCTVVFQSSFAFIPSVATESKHFSLWQFIVCISMCVKPPFISCDFTLNESWIRILNN